MLSLFRFKTVFAPGRLAAAGVFRSFHRTALLWSRSIPYKLTDIGEGIREVQVLKVYVKPGDHVCEMDKICEVQSDKATVEITSRYAGTIEKVYAGAGEMTKVGQTLVDIIVEEAQTDDAAPDTSLKPSAPQNSEGSQLPVPPLVPSHSASSKVLASPASRFLAKQYGVDLAQVPHSGKDDRVTKEDILNHVKKHGITTANLANPCTREAQSLSPVLTSAVGVEVALGCAGYVSGLRTEDGDEVVPIVGVRKGMAKTMTQAASIPMFGFNEEFELTKLMDLRASLKEVVQQRTKGKLKLSYLPFILKSASLALRDYPDINAHCAMDCSALLRKKAHHIGFAMDTPNGLIVPVVRDVHKKSVFEIAQDLHDLTNKGYKNQLTAADMADGTFTISNIGAIGATSAHPVLLPPQVGITALGRIQQLPRFDAQGNVIKMNIMVFSFSADHRVIDGATMVRFANTWKRYVQQPGDILLDLR